MRISVKLADGILRENQYDNDDNILQGWRMYYNLSRRSFYILRFSP
jgi:hypothetical protein